MDDWQIVVLEELKAINRKLERLEDNVDSEMNDLEAKVTKDLEPIKRHVTQVKLIALLASLLIPVIFAYVQQ